MGTTDIAFHTEFLKLQYPIPWAFYHIRENDPLIESEARDYIERIVKLRVFI